MGHRSLTFAALSLFAALLVAGCGSGETTTTVTVSAEGAPVDEVGVIEPGEPVNNEPGVVAESEPRLSFAAEDEQRAPAFFEQPASGVMTVTMGAGQILEFRQTAGDPAFEQGARDRLQQGIWAFYGDGRAYFDTVDVRRDLFPLSGGWRAEENTVGFRIGGQVQDSYSNWVTSEMLGIIDMSVDPPVATFNWATETGGPGDPGGAGSATFDAKLEMIQR